MRKMFVFVLSITMLVAQGVTITTGSKKGNYYRYGIRFATMINNSKVLSSKGSVQNLNRLASNDAQVAFTQLDAFRWYSTKHPDATGKLDYVGDLKKECVFLVVKKDGNVKNDGDLQQKGVKIAVGKIGSGSQVTWDYMRGLENGFKEATAIPKGGSRALAKVSSGKYDAALFVQTPSQSSWLVKTVLKNDNLEFGSITDWDLNDKYDGTPIYTFEKVQISDGFFGKSVKTICTQAGVVVNESVDEDTVDMISDILLNRRNYILSGEK